MGQTTCSGAPRALELRRQEVHSHRDSGGGPSSAPSWLCVTLGLWLQCSVPQFLPPESGHSQCSASRRHSLLLHSLSLSPPTLPPSPLAQPHPLPGTPGEDSGLTLTCQWGRGFHSGLFATIPLLGLPVRSCTTRLGPLPALTTSPLPLVHCFHRMNEREAGSCLHTLACAGAVFSTWEAPALGCHLSGLPSGVLSCERPFLTRSPQLNTTPKGFPCPSNSFTVLQTT